MRGAKHVIYITVAFFSIYLVYEYAWYRGSLPRDVGVLWPIEISGKGNVFGGCGAVIFHLSPGTKASINKEGVTYFRNARQARKSSKFHYRYENWKETPLPRAFLGDGMWPGLACSDADIERKKAIVASAKMDGSYYSTKSNALLLVIPNRRIVVYSYFD